MNSTVSTRARKSGKTAKSREVAQAAPQNPPPEKLANNLRKCMTIADTAMNLDACEIAALTGKLRERLIDFVNTYEDDSIEAELRAAGFSRKDANDEDGVAMDLLMEATGFLWALSVYDDILTGRIVDRGLYQWAEGRLELLRKPR